MQVRPWSPRVFQAPDDAYVSLSALRLNFFQYGTDWTQVIPGVSK